LHDEYKAARDEDFEGAVTGVWNLLLNHYFDQSNGFVHRTQDKVLALGGGATLRYACAELALDPVKPLLVPSNMD
jgi:hypothetical protein